MANLSKLIFCAAIAARHWLSIKARRCLIRMHTAHEVAKEAAFIRSHGHAVLIATGIDARANA
jgi:hypothetical protein